MASRIIIHCDLDAFFAAVETLHHNLDSSIPLILGSDPKGGKGRGIVSTCNYAARKYGIHSAMPIGEAWRRCPSPPHGPGNYLRSTRGLYSRASRKVMNILSEHADKFEQASIDEAYLDVTEYCEGDWDRALALTRDLQTIIMAQLGLSSSFGIGPTRILAKMGSEENKPAGIHRTLPDEIVNFFEGRSVREVPGIGPKTAQRLIVELKDKFTFTDHESIPSDSTYSKNQQDAYNALLTLGYKSMDIQHKIQSIITLDPNISTEKLIKDCLKDLK